MLTLKKNLFGRPVFFLNSSSGLSIGKKISDAEHGTIEIFSSVVEVFSMMSFFVFSEIAIIALARLTALLRKIFSRMTAFLLCVLGKRNATRS